MGSARGNFVGQALPPAAKKQQAGMLALQRQVEATSSQRSVAAFYERLVAALIQSAHLVRFQLRNAGAPGCIFDYRSVTPWSKRQQQRGVSFAARCQTDRRNFFRL